MSDKQYTRRCGNCDKASEKISSQWSLEEKILAVRAVLAFNKRGYPADYETVEERQNSRLGEEQCYYQCLHCGTQYNTDEFSELEVVEI